MNRPRTVLALALAVVLTVFVAACGNEEENDYVDRVNELQLTYVDDVSELTSSPASGSASVAETATDLAELTSGLAADIEAVEPPDQVADLHQRLVDELENVAEQVGSLEERLSDANQQQAIKAASELTSAVTESQTELQSLINQINEEL